VTREKMEKGERKREKMEKGEQKRRGKCDYILFGWGEKGEKRKRWAHHLFFIYIGKKLGGETTLRRKLQNYPPLFHPILPLLYNK
jgi:hypothetical protein